MKIEEAIENLKDINTIMRTRHMCRSMDGELEEGEAQVYRERFESLNMAISALEKQIPKAPIDDPEAWLCPNCKSGVSHEQQRMYCRQCGQLIAWDKV